MEDMHTNASAGISRRTFISGSAIAGTLAALGLAGCAPKTVSYTHLDVYKRQMVNLSRSICVNTVSRCMKARDTCLLYTSCSTPRTRRSRRGA